MDFKIRKIKKKKSNLHLFRFLNCFVSSRKRIVITSLLGCLLLLWGLNNITIGGKKHHISKILSPLSSDKYGHTNILLLGVAGTNKEGGNLTDSIMVVSIDPQGPSVSFLSFPRDLFISSSVGNHKINEIYARARSKAIAPLVKKGVLSMNELSEKTIKKVEKKGLNVAKKAISDFTGIPIHYGVIVNFDVFQETVDELGGLDIYVPKDIEDPFYPDGKYGFETFTIRRGPQHLNGATALKYARSRKTSSDFDRARRQQDIILAIRDKAANKDLLTDMDKLKSFYTLFQKNVTMDLSLVEIVALAKTAVGIDYKRAVSAVLNDDPTKQGGFLYVPDRAEYGGRFVLRPKNLVDTQKFINLVLINPKVLLEQAQLEILNGSGIEGEARRLSLRLKRFGLHVIQIGNYEEESVRQGFYQNLTDINFSKTETFLEDLLRLKKLKTETPFMKNEDQNLVDIQIVIGTN